MNLGISMWSYYAAWKRGQMDIVGFVGEAKRLGVAGVELLDFFWKDRDAEAPAVGAALDIHEMRVGVYSVSNNFALPTAEERRRQEEIVRAGVDSALYFGAAVVRVFAGNPQPGMSLEDALDGIVASFHAVTSYAADRGVVLALENHGRLAGRAEQVEQIIRAVGSPALQANPDTGNFLLVHDTPHDAVERLAPLAAMVHFKDFRAAPDGYSGAAYAATDGLQYIGTALGEGEVALGECVSALRRGGFGGWLNIEYEGAEDPMTAVPRCVEHARMILAEESR